MLDDHPICDEELLRRLPLPLAQLYRRGHNARSPLERHQAGYYLWEAGLKLLASAALVQYLARAEPDRALCERLQALERPAMGHWWSFARLLVPALADLGDERYATIHDLLLGRNRDDMPRAAGLDAVICEALDGRRSARATVRLSDLFDRLVRYRNVVLGHGATGQHGTEFYERISRALLACLTELFNRLDPLAGRRLIWTSEVHGRPNGSFQVDQFELTGETARRVAPLELPPAEFANLPRPERLYLVDSSPGTSAPDAARSPTASPATAKVAARLQLLHPLMRYQAEANETFFYSTRRGEDRLEYLCYTSGGTLTLREPLDELPPRIAQLLGGRSSAATAEAAGGAETPSDKSAAIADATRRSANAPPSTAIQPADGERAPSGPLFLGEFELLSELGRGGMGIVYRAWQPSLARQVALKSMLRSGDPKTEVRFAREIKALGRVDHPHLIKIYNSGSDGDRWFYSMELIEGATLAAVYDRLFAASSRAETLNLVDWQQALSTVADEARSTERPIPGAASPEIAKPRFAADSATSGPTWNAGQRPAIVPALPVHSSESCVRHLVTLIRQIAEAAQALHDAGVVHRDIKPGNIMLTADGREAVLMDLGLAQLLDDSQAQVTRTRQFVGTLRYASPEQVLGAAKLDARSDVYSLGATLWELLTLRPMFAATDDMPTPQLMQRIQFDEPVPVRRHNLAVPADLEAIVMKCLEKDPRRRYASAHGLAEDLANWLANKPVIARRRTRIYVLRKYLARHRLAAIAGTAAVLLLAIGYLGLCDAGVRLPGSAMVRGRLDRLGVSLFRSIASEATIQSAAKSLDAQFYNALFKAPTDDGWFSKNLDPRQSPPGLGRDVWSHSQALTSLLSSAAGKSEDQAELRRRLALPFSQKLMVLDKQGNNLGWAVRPPKESYTVAQPALWSAAALAIALGKPGFLTGSDRAAAQQQLAETQAILKNYRPTADGGWNMYAQQTEPGQHNPYVTALALLALLEAHRAEQPWEGSPQRRDELLAATAGWLMNAYDSADDPPGWRESAIDNSRPLDGLTLQVYSLLLRAEAEAGVKLPTNLVREIPRHLARCFDRGGDYPDSSGKFVIDFTDPNGNKVVGSEPVKFLWYPWAIACADRWLERAAKVDASETTDEDRIAVRRTLGHLIFDLGTAAAAKAPSEWTFVVSETLYGLNAAK